MLNIARHTHVIPGTRRLPYLASNIAAGSITLDDLQKAALNSLFARGAVKGERYTEKGWVGIESARG